MNDTPTDESKQNLAESIEAIILTATRAILDETGNLPETLDLETPIYAQGGSLDSLNLVMLISEVEAEISRIHKVDLVIASERAMSRKHSPFRSVGSLKVYVLELMQVAP